MAQGSVLSPLLFNKYLDQALQSSPVFSSALSRGDLIAYADDIVILTQSIAMMETILTELENLEEAFGLKINKKKTVFLSNKKELTQYRK